MERLRQWLVLILAGACLGLGYALYQDGLELRLLKAREEESTALQKRQEKEIAQLRRSARAAAEARRRSAAAPGAASGAAGQGGGAGSVVIRMSDVLRDHPELAASQERERQRMILRMYGEAIAGLNLSPEKLAQLRKLLVDRNESQQDAAEAARAAGIQPGSPAYGQAMRQAYADVQQQIVALIGTDGVAALEQGQQLQMYRNQVENTYAPDLLEAGLGLTAEQQSGLAQALQSINAPSNPGFRTPGYRQADAETGLSPADQDVLAKAAEILSPAQVDIIKADLADQNQRNAVMQSYFQAARAKSGAPVSIMITQ